MQRVHLAAVLGTGLADTLFVLDEPTLGLHPRDHARLGQMLRRLCDARNTVVFVEHDPGFIARADHAVELGPRAGRRRGPGAVPGRHGRLPAGGRHRHDGDAAGGRGGPDPAAPGSRPAVAGGLRRQARAT